MEEGLVAWDRPTGASTPPHDCQWESGGGALVSPVVPGTVLGPPVVWFAPFDFPFVGRAPDQLQCTATRGRRALQLVWGARLKRKAEWDKPDHRRGCFRSKAIVPNSAI